MTEDQSRLVRYLAYAGVLPPWLCLALHLTVAPALAAFASISYGAVIASFVCGMHWGIYMRPTAQVPVNLLLTSNAGGLAAWAMVLVSVWSVAFAGLGLALVLALLLVIDRRLWTAGLLQPWFWPVRRNASIGLGAGLILWSILA
ncbi:MAG: hypothetical protein Devi2KO_24290 [Devosia indica]